MATPNLDGRTIPLVVSTLFALFVLSSQFFVTSALLSPAAYSVCAGFRTLGVDLLRNISRFYNIRNFGECYQFFREKPDGLTLSAAGTEAESVHDRAELFLQQVQQLTLRATTECAALTDGGQGALEADNDVFNQSSSRNETEADKQAQIERLAACQSLQVFAGESTQLVNVWLTCRETPFPKTNFTKLLDSIVLSCMETLKNAINSTKLTVITSCDILRRSMSSGSSAVIQDTCKPGAFSILDSLVASFTYLVCSTLAIEDAYIDIEHLQGLEKDFRGIFFTRSDLPAMELTILEQSFLVVCHSLFPVDVSRSLAPTLNHSTFQILPLCKNFCHGVQNILNNVDQFLEIGKSNTLDVVRYCARNACDSWTSQHGECLDFNTTALTVIKRNSSLTLPPTFCLNISCHYPLHSTPNIHHWDTIAKTDILHLVDDSHYWFPKLAIPFHRQPVCGALCGSLVQGDQQTGRVFRTIFGAFGVLASLVAIAAYVLNRDKLRHIARRLNAYMNIAYVLGQGSDSLYAAFPSAAEKVACYADGTVRLSEPNAVEGASLCVIFAAKYMLFTFIMDYLGVAVMLEWYLMVSRLGDLKKWDKFARTEKKRELVYILATVTLSVVLTIIPLARRRVEGHPGLGHCLVDSIELFYIMAVPFLFAATCMVICLSFALPKLWKLFKEVKVRPKNTVDFASRNGPQRKSSMSAKRLVSLLKLLTLYMIVTVVGFFALAVIYIVAFARDDAVIDGYRSHVVCMASRCNTAVCSVPKTNVGFYIVQELYTSCYAIIISLWAFNWNAYWRSHLSKTLSTRRPSNWTVLSALTRRSEENCTDIALYSKKRSANDAASGVRAQKSNSVTFQLD